MINWDYVKQQYDEGLRSLYFGDGLWVSRESYEDMINWDKGA